MLRRKFVAGLGVSVVTGQAFGSMAPLGSPTSAGTPMRVWVENPEIVRQECPEWCWAASSAMIFAAHGHRIDQKKVVERVFHLDVCRPAPATSVIGEVLSGVWQDDSDRVFKSTVVAAYDPSNGIMNIDNTFIMGELAANRPLLYANTHHAMVVTAMDYMATPSGIYPQAVGVLDPWPYNHPFHPLDATEMRPSHAGGQMMFLASVNVADG